MAVSSSTSSPSKSGSNSTLNSNSSHGLIQLEEELGSSFVVLDSIDAVLQRNALSKRAGSNGGLVDDEHSCSGGKDKTMDSHFESPTCVAELDNINNGLLFSPVTNQVSKQIVIREAFYTPTFHTVAQRRWSASPSSIDSSSSEYPESSLSPSSMTTTLQRVDSSPAIPLRKSLDSSSPATRSRRSSISATSADSSPAVPRRSSIEEESSSSSLSMPRRSSFDSSPSIPRRSLSPGSGTRQTRRVPKGQWDTVVEHGDKNGEYNVPSHEGDRANSHPRTQRGSYSPKRNVRKMSPKRSKNSPKKEDSTKRVVGFTHDYNMPLNDDRNNSLSRSQHGPKGSMRNQSLVRCKSSPAISRSSSSSKSGSMSSDSDYYKTPKPRRRSYKVASNASASALLELVPIPESPDSMKGFVRISNYEEEHQELREQRHNSFHSNNRRSFEDFKIARRKSEKHRRLVSAEFKRKKDRNSVSLNDIAGANKKGNVVIATSRSSLNFTSQNATWDNSNIMPRSSSSGGGGGGFSNDRWQTKTTSNNVNARMMTNNKQSMDSRVLMAKLLMSQSQRKNAATAALLGSTPQQKLMGGHSSSSMADNIATNGPVRRNSQSLRAALGSMAPGGLNR